MYLEVVWDENGKKNEVVFWDKIMPRRSIKDINIKKMRVKYRIVDVNSNLRDKKVKVNLWIEHVPVFGLIHR